MSLLIFLLFVGVTTHDEWAYSAVTFPFHRFADVTLFGLAPEGLSRHPGIAFLFVQLLRVILMVYYAWRCRRYHRLLGKNGKNDRLRPVHHGTPWLRLSMVFLFFLELGLGSLKLAREIIGNWVVVDEMIVMLPTLMSLLLAWTLYFPVDLKIRQSMLISQMDENESPAAMWSLGQYLKLNSRMELATMGLPLLAIMAWRECFALFFPGVWSTAADYVNLPPDARSWAEESLLFIGTLSIFLFAPLLVLKVWRTNSLSPGETRDALSDMLKRYRVKVRDLLVWHTYGGVTNAAVIGTIPRVRYILLTDQLLSTMPMAWLKAIMAHEIAHIKYRHLYWYLVILIAIMFLLSVLWALAGKLFILLGAMEPAINNLFYRFQMNGLPALLGPIYLMLGWWLIFGWVSRNFERQADTFAVEHFAHLRLEDNEALDGDDSEEAPAKVRPGIFQGRINDDDVTPMLEVMNTLQKRMAHMDQDETQGQKTDKIDFKKNVGRYWQSAIISWRHGSLSARRDYLRQLVGQDMENLRIHRTVKYIKWMSLGIIICFTLLSIYELLIARMMDAV